MRIKSVALATILTLALVLRLGIGVFLGFDAPPDRAACGADTVEFEHMGWSAAQGQGFVAWEGSGLSAFRAPGYPMLLAVLYRACGHRYFVNRIMLSLIGTATCWLAYLLARRLGLSLWAALLSALLTAILPLQFYYCGHFMSEPVAAFLNVATVLLLVMALGSADWRVGLLLAAGATCGLAALTRPAALLVPPVYGVLSLLSRPIKLRASVGSTVLLIVGMLVAVAPWTIRNYGVFNRFALVATNGGSTFWGANNDIVAKPGPQWGMWISTNFDRERKEREVLTLSNEVDRDKKEWEIGIEWVKHNPGKLPVLLVGKFYRLLKPFPDSPNRPYRLVVGASQVVLLPLSLLGLGLVLARSDRSRFIPVNAQLLALLGTTAIFYGSERFRATYEPFLAIYAAVAVTWLLGRLCRTFGRQDDYGDRTIGNGSG